MQKIWTLLFFGFSLLIAQNVPYKIIKNAKGEGWNYRNARLNAFRDALERAYGVQIDSTTEVKNFSEIADTILSTSKGVIQSYHGEQYQVSSDGSSLVTFAQIIVSESAKGLEKDIAQISDDLEHLNCPPIGILQEASDPDFISYIQTFLINEIGVKVVPPTNTECELVIRPYLRLEENTMTIRGDVVNKKGEVVSSCSNFKLLYHGSEDKKFAADILLLNLLMQFVMTPTVKITNIRSYLEAEALLEIFRAMEDSVTKCALKTYQMNFAEYDVNIKGNLRQLCSQLIKTGVFDPQQVTLNEFSRILILSYLGNKIKPILPNRALPSTTQPDFHATIIPPENTANPPQVDPILPPEENTPNGIPQYPGFQYSERKTFSCGTEQFTVDLYVHLKTGLSFVSLPPVGESVPFSFQMGSPQTEPQRSPSEKQHRVQFFKPFLISQTEVTQGVWEKIMGTNPSFFKEGDAYPVEMVSWEEASNFCQETGLALPSESQFEYAMRGGSKTAFCFGESISTTQANYNGKYVYNQGKLGEFRQKTTPVRSFPPNAYGLYDMHGNIIEWCQDSFEDYPNNNSVKPQDPKQANKYRVIRGGGWNSPPERLRSASRGKGNIEQRMQNFGFRVCYPPK